MRLMILAEHLSNNKFETEYKKVYIFYSDDSSRSLIGRKDMYHYLFPQVVYELATLFNEFEVTKDGNIIYVTEPYLALYNAMKKFFGLEIHEFLYLFSVDHKDSKKLRNKIHTEDFKNKVIVANMYEFLQSVIDNHNKTK
jgi:hypothetical protein